MKIRYRGFRAIPFIRWHAVRIGATRMYRIGPIALFLSGRD